MKIVLFETPDEPARYGLLAPDGVLSLRDLLSDDSPQEMMRQLIDTFETLRPRLESLSSTTTSIPMADTRLLSPVPRPGRR
ncbi:MAG TPA: hypothetical protein VF937_17490 [Chloroflexota bacterium]